MAKTTSAEHVNVFLRMKPSSLEKAKKDALERRQSESATFRDAIETFFFEGWMGPDMTATLERDRVRQKMDRLQYFKALLEARYRKLVLEEGKQSPEVVPEEGKSSAAPRKHAKK
jgi:hypothetical protein